MYLEHISAVHSVRGDISRTAAPEKASMARAPGAVSLWRLAEPGRLPRQRLAVIAVDLALLLRRRLRKPHLTGVALNQCCSPRPPPHTHTVLGVERGEESDPPSPSPLPSPLIKPDTLYEVMHRAYGEAQGGIQQKSNSKSPTQWKNYWYYISGIGREQSSGLLFSSPQGSSVTC